MTLRSNPRRVRALKLRCPHERTKVEETATHKLLVCANPDCGHVLTSRRLDAFTGKGRS